MKTKNGPKGKFQLFSYEINDFLIIYESLNKIKKYVGISIFYSEESLRIIRKLNKLLSQDIIKFYTIQINVALGLKYFYILFFEETTKEELIKKFNYLHKIFQIMLPNINFKFFEKQQLEKQYFAFISEHKNEFKRLLKNKDSLILKNEKTSILIKCCCIDLNLIFDKSSFFQNLLIFLKNFNFKGYLLFTFKKDSLNIIYTSSYIIEVEENISKSRDFIRELNEFYGITLFYQQNINLKDFYKLFWRINVNEKWVYWNKVIEIFPIRKNLKNESENKISKALIKKFNIHSLKYVQLNKDLYLVEKKIVIYLVHELKSDELIKLIKRYFLKYFIYFIIIKKEHYDKIEKHRIFKSFENISFFYIKDFLLLNLHHLINKYKSISIPNQN